MINTPAALALFLAAPVLAAPVLGALDNGAQDDVPADPPAPVAPELPEIVITPPKAEYRTLEATLALFARWVEARPNAVSLVPLGTSSGGRPITALRIAAPGGSPIATRKTLLLVGGMDGVSLHGAEEVLGVAAGLAADPSSLPAELAFLCLPWASPDGLAAELERLNRSGAGSLGRDATPVDDDLDGLSGEDPADDLDGDGRVTMMLIEEPAGAWQRAPDARFLVPAGSEFGSGPRYGIYREGRDDDQDGVFNEDGPGGVRVDRNFPVGWRGPFAPVAPGALPFSSPAAAALEHLLGTGKLAGALFFDGHSGRAEVSGGLEVDALSRVTAELFATGLGLTGDEGLAPIRKLAPVGAAIDWFPRMGVPAARFSFWGPEIGLGRGQVKAASFRTDEFVPPADMLEDFCSPGAPSAAAGGWRRFLDERRGGIGFIDWHPVDLGDGVNALVGGWEAAVLNNPPEEQLGRSVTMAMDLVAGLIASLPEVSVEVIDVRREGELCTLTAKLQTSATQADALPVDFLAPGGIELVLDLPPGARLIAGPARELIGAEALAGASIEWLIFAPQDALLGLRVLRSSDGAELDRREVRP